jgi:uncharacterized membrane protein YbhN (UPF0104 family)
MAGDVWWASGVGAEVAFLWHSIILLLAVALGGLAYVAWNKKSNWQENTNKC